MTPHAQTILLLAIVPIAGIALGRTDRLPYGWHFVGVCLTLGPVVLAMRHLDSPLLRTWLGQATVLLVWIAAILLGEWRPSANNKRTTAR
jgi:hypothetical protein